MPDFLNLSKKDVYKAPPGNAPGTGQAVFSVMQDTRVYICGVDVTSLVTSVSTRIAPITQGGNSCSINIQNPNSIFTITKRNIQGGFTLNSDTLEYNESVKKTIYDAKRRLQIASNPSIIFIHFI